MRQLDCLLSQELLPYTGDELRPHFLLTRFSLKGDAILAFMGPCHVKTESLVDWEDRVANETIEAKSMLHFIGEFFGATLPEVVGLQRLFIARASELLNTKGCAVWRKGDDLFVGEGDQKRKLSVSIVTSSAVSQLLHLGINIDETGAPVAAIGLKDLGVDASQFAQELLESFSDEYSQIQWACAKVRPVM